MSRLVLFCGAGASYAVNPAKYPMTSGFFEIIDEVLKGRDHEILSRIVSYIKEKNEVTQVDIEQVLWALDEILTSLEGISSSSIAWPVLEPRVQSKLYGEQICDQGTFNKLSKFRPPLNSLKNALNSKIFDVYASDPSDDELESNWTPFLKHIREIYNRFDIFTTNYDPILEYALQRSEMDSMLGISGNRHRPRLDIERWKTRKAIETNDGLLTKLHGSVNWHKPPNADEVYVSYPQFDGNFGGRAIIYPGFKGFPEDEPFVSFHNYLEKCLSDCDAVIVIGFAFRDEYIANLFKDFCVGKKVISINPLGGEPLKRILRDCQMIEIKKGFGAESLKELCQFQ